MNVGMLAKWFYDNNFLVREDVNQDRLKSLVFCAACSLGLDEEVIIEDRAIILDIDFMDYNFKEATINLLNCINRAIGFNEKFKNSYMFDSILIELGDNIKTTYSKLNKYYNRFKNNVLQEYDGYDFNKKYLRINNNIYFINFDRELTNDEKKLLELNKNEQRIYEVYLQDGELIIL